MKGPVTLRTEFRGSAEVRSYLHKLMYTYVWMQVQSKFKVYLDASMFVVDVKGRMH